MTQTYRIGPRDLPAALRHEAKRVGGALDTARRRAAQKFKAKLVTESDRLHLVDTGAYKNGWRARGPLVWNDSPYAGVVELGARPHPVSRAGVEAIAGWVRRVLGAVQGPVQEFYAGAPVRRVKRAKLASSIGKDEALSIAYAIAAKIKKEGQKPRYVVRDALPYAKQYLREEFEKKIREPDGYKAKGGRK